MTGGTKEASSALSYEMLLFVDAIQHLLVFIIISTLTKLHAQGPCIGNPVCQSS